jgi:hypothetical protein
MESQTYQIALSPELDITFGEFATSWNETPKARAIAEARLIEGKQFDGSLIAGILISVGTGVASNLLTELIKDVIQRLLDKKGVQSSQGTPTHKSTQIEQREKSDGTKIFIVDIDER